MHSRYYDPQIRRFINADSYISTGDGFLGCNMYAYCNNNPVIYADYTGNSITIAIFGIAISVKSLITLAAGATVTALTFAAIHDLYQSGYTITLPTISLFDRTASASRPYARVTGQDLTNIAKQYDLYKCKEAADEMYRKDNGRGAIINLYFPYAHNGFVCCDRYPSTAISINGNHYGYLFDGKVYCNIYPEGLLKDEWISSFYDISGLPPIVTYLK